MSNLGKSLDWIRLNTIEYANALNTQNRVLEGVATGNLPPSLLTLEHPKTITLGKNSSESHLLVEKSLLEDSHIKLVRTDRGGQITGHELGQLVAYPIIPVADMGVRKYVCRLEQTVIDTLHDYGIESQRDKDHPGVWVENSKICAVGIRVKKRVSMHGIALNVNNSLEVFKMMTPCGIEGRGVTSMAKLLGKQLNFQEVEQKFAKNLSKTFKLQVLNQREKI